MIAVRATSVSASNPWKGRPSGYSPGAVAIYRMREHKMTVAEPSKTGHAVYTPAVLHTYDWIVHRISNRLLWHCPTSELRRLYDRNVSYAHVDIGVATGYFLDKARWPVSTPSITLIDLNQNCLDAASQRIGRYRPHTILADVLKPLPSRGPFRSAGLCYLLHTIPGTIDE